MKAPHSLAKDRDSGPLVRFPITPFQSNIEPVTPSLNYAPYHPAVPGWPLKGPTIRDVIHPP